MKVGADYLGDGKCRFRVWAPIPKKLDLKIITPTERIIPMKLEDRGYWSVELDNISPDSLYYYRVNGETNRPDPASDYQPHGVHEPSQVIDHKSFVWEDKEWQGIEKEKYIIYELHVGTFTPEGTFEAIIPRLDELKDIGINVIEIMPVAQFPGERNWGYDGVYTYAPQNSYGGPEGFKKLINACHNKGIAVCLDVVYNHFGPEGFYAGEYGHYLIKKYQSPWGDAVNFDDAWSTDVRNYFIENAIHWFENYHIDALRLDAIHTIYDMSAVHILEEIALVTEKFSKEKGRKYYLIAESDLNNSKVVKSRELCGYGLDAQWSDDFHHSLRTLLTCETNGYYADFGKIEHFSKSLKDGYAYYETYSNFRKRIHGNSPKDVPASSFVVFSQNHDQIGNRMLGDRLSEIVSFEAYKLSSAVVLLSPYIPLLFMGQEYYEDNPFLYFVHHSDKDLIENVRKGRKEEFAFFHSDKEVPDPQSENTFNDSKLSWEKRNSGKYNTVLTLYKTLIMLRNTVPALSTLSKESMKIVSSEEDKIVTMLRWNDEKDSMVYVIFNFNCNDVTFLPEISQANTMIKILDSSDSLWGGEGSLLPDQLYNNETITMKKHSFVIYKKDGV